jgi:Flavin containing amine oxidoreductase
MEDGSSIRIKAARHLVKKKHHDLKSVKLKIDDSSLPQPASQLPPLGPSTGGHIPWENVLKAFRDKWYKEQKEYEASNQAERRWDNKGVPIFPSEYRVAIIGAGVAGLRTAMLLQRMNIPYKIFEASDRPGGRLFTYHFLSKPPKNPKGKHDYYDVGGMRFPNNKANEETFSLFKDLNLKVIKYVFSNDHNILLYNGEF